MFDGLFSSYPLFKLGSCSRFVDNHSQHRIPLADRINHIMAGNHFPENGVFSIEMRLGGVGDEELASVGVLPGIGH